MAKVDDTRINAIKALFETDDVPTQVTLSDLIDAIQEAAQDHEHTATGGSGSGTGDATLANASKLLGYELADVAPSLGDLQRWSGSPLRWRPDGPYAARAYNNGPLVIPSGAWTYLTFDSERFDTHAIHSTVANTGRLTVDRAAPYQVSVIIVWDPNANGVRGVQILLNGTVVRTNVRDASAVGETYLDASTLSWAAATEYFRCRVWQNTGGNLSVRDFANFSPDFMLARIP